MKTDRSFAALLLLFLLTQTEFLPRVWRQREAEHRHGGDQQTRHDQVEEVVQCPPPVTANHSSGSISHLWTNHSSPDLDGEGDVQVGLRAAVVDNFVSFCRDALIEII